MQGIPFFKTRYLVCMAHSFKLQIHNIHSNEYRLWRQRNRKYSQLQCYSFAFMYAPRKCRCSANESQFSCPLKLIKFVNRNQKHESFWSKKPKLILIYVDARKNLIKTSPAHFRYIYKYLSTEEGRLEVGDRDVIRKGAPCYLRFNAIWFWYTITPTTSSQENFLPDKF